MADRVGCPMDLVGACAIASFADRSGRNSGERNLESILLPAPDGSTRRGPGVGARASDGGLALRAVRQRHRSRSRTGALDTRAPGMGGDRSRDVSSRGPKRNCGTGAILWIARTVVAAGAAEFPARFRIVRV